MDDRPTDEADAISTAAGFDIRDAIAVSEPIDAADAAVDADAADAEPMSDQPTEQQQQQQPKPSKRPVVVRKTVATPWQQLQRRESERNKKRKLLEMEGVDPLVRAIILANRKRSKETKEAVRVAPKTTATAAAGPLSSSSDMDRKSSADPWTMMASARKRRPPVPAFGFGLPSKKQPVSVSSSDPVPKADEKRPIDGGGGRSAKTERPAKTETDDQPKTDDKKPLSKPEPKTDENKPTDDQKPVSEPVSKPVSEPVSKPVPKTDDKKSADAAKPKTDDAKKSSSFQSRAADRSFDTLTGKYSGWRGKKFHDPAPDYFPPPVTTRAEAIHRHSNDKSLPIGVSQVMEMLDELWLFGWTSSCSTVAVELTGFCPFFYINAPLRNPGKPPVGQADADALMATLNQAQHRPNDFRKNGQKTSKFGGGGRGGGGGGWQNKFRQQKQKKQKPPPGGMEIEDDDDNDDAYTGPDKPPVTKIEVEKRLNGVVYKGRTDIPVFRIEFASMAAFRHYRQKLARHEIAVGWRVQLYHEEHSLTQMFFNRVPIALFSYVSVDGTACNFLPESAWTELARLRLSDDANLAAAAAKKSEEQIDGDDEFFDDEKTEPAIEVEEPNEPLPRTSALLEGKLPWSALRPITVDATPPLVVAVFDIETISYEAADHQRRYGRPPPLPPASEDEYAPKTIPEVRSVDEPVPIATVERMSDVTEYRDVDSDDDDGGQLAADLSSLTVKSTDTDTDTADKSKSGKATATKSTATKATEKEFAGRFPIASKPKDAAAIISTQFVVVGDDGSFLKILHILGKPTFEPTDLPDTVVFSFGLDKEKEMLEHWSAMLRYYDIEVLAGYNSISYDGAYLVQRATVLKSTKALDAFSRFNALPNERIKKPYRYKECLPTARRGGTGLNDQMPQQTMPGVIQLDALKIIKQLKKMDSYSLKEVAAVLLKGKISKFDMPYAWISPYFGAGGGYLRRLAIYCEQDVNVTLTVMIKMFLIGHAIEIARATYTSISAQMLQGQQIRTWNLLVRYAHYNGWLLDEIARLDAQEAFGVQVDRLPRYLKKFIPKDDERFNDDNKKDAAKIKYAGATVLVPTTGFYTSLVCTADFASLYPSIMVSHVLCFSTWTEHRYDPKTGQIWFPIHGSSLAEQNFAAYKTWNVETEAKPTAEELAGRDLIMVVVDRVNDITTCFTINRGAMLPSILTDLLALRKRVRKEEAVAKENGDKFLADVLDARQAAIKVTCNAAYGFCGAIIGFFGFVAIASTTCTIGRFKIEQTKKVFEDELGGTVIYGDTDSVFVIFKHLESQPNKTIDEIREDVKALADRGCKLVSSRLPPPMKLEFEKAMTPFLMIIKKQYCGQWIFPEPKTFFKGTANVRRDSCDLARKTIGDTLKAVLATPNDKSAILKPLNDALAKMVDPDLDINLLVRTVGKNIIKKTEELQQIKLIQKIEKRRGAPLDIGTRVRMIITLPQGGTRVRTKDDGFLHDAEEVQYAIDNGIKPDRAYYCERQLLRPLVRYIGSIIPPAEIKALVDAALAKIYVLQSNVHTVTDYFGRMI